MVLSSSGGSYDVGCGYMTQKDIVLVGFFARAASASAKFKAAKLEFGPTQTLAYQDEEGNWQLFETPDYGEELAKCQRYLINIENSEMRISRSMTHWSAHGFRPKYH